MTAPEAPRQSAQPPGMPEQGEREARAAQDLREQVHSPSSPRVKALELAAQRATVIARVGLGISTFLALTALTVAVLGIIDQQSNGKDEPETLVAVLSGVLAGAAVALLVPVSLRRIRAYRELQNERRREETIATLAKLEDGEIRTLLEANRQEMERYEDIARRQTRQSFTVALGASIASLAVLAATICLVIYAARDGTAIAVTVTIIGSVGTAVSGLVTRTFITVYRASVSQMGEYYESPLVSSYALTAERLAGTLTNSEDEDAAKREVITALISRVAYQPTGVSDGTSVDK